jgi:hypothetical protein
MEMPQNFAPAPSQYLNHHYQLALKKKLVNTLFLLFCSSVALNTFCVVQLNTFLWSNCGQQILPIHCSGFGCALSTTVRPEETTSNQG